MRRLLPFLLALTACHDTTASAPPVASTSTSTSTPTAAPAPAPIATAPAFAPQRVWAEDKAMGTHVTFAAYTTPTIGEAAVHTAFANALTEIRRIEALMTTWRSDSELSRVNAAAGSGKPIVVGEETFDVVKEALHASEMSGGAFDITFESLHGLWKFDQDKDQQPKLPTDAQIKERLPLVDYHHVHLDPAARAIYLDKAGVKISLGGIAKGYAVDKAAKVLDEAGLTSFFVQAGGDLFARGTKPGGGAWSAGVRDPRGPEGSYFAILPLRDHAFSTAGDYERTYGVIDGKRYHHIIDPKTGKPATASRSVTIWAPTALLADEIDDAVFIMGPEKGLALVESLDGVGAVIVDASNRVWISKRLEGVLQITGVPTDAP